jgi:DNA-binding MarR family transcriptional regulator
MEMRESRPLGYWLKHLDHLIEEAFEQTLAAHGLTRRHWQVLHTVAATPRSVADLEDELGLFLRDDPGSLTALVDDLTHRGWVDRTEAGRIQLTPEGRRGHGAVQRQVEQIRRRVTERISDADYTATVKTLGEMAANLESRDP